MILAFLGVVTAVFSIALGAGLGWILHDHFSGTQLEMELAAAKTLRAKDTSSQPDPDHGRAAELMARLAELATAMASEIGKHTGNIEAINAELAMVKEGDAGAVVAAVTRILNANEQMQQELLEAENRLQEQQHELTAQTEAARTDPLTRITNRRALDEELKKCVHEFQRAALPFSVMVLDIDHFKKINDTQGHLAGDEVLKFVAQALESQAREGELVARYGGEEFVMVFRGATAAECRDRADRIRASIQAGSIAFDGQELRVAASAGIAEIRRGEDEKLLIRRADEALYISKKAGRNCSHWNDGRQNLPLGKVPLGAADDDFASAEADGSPPQRFDLREVQFSDANFSPDLNRRVSEWKRTGHPFSVAVCALDDFELLAKQHGEDALLHMLAATGGVLSSCLRDMDQLAAFGNGIFAISLPTAEIQAAVQVADRIQQALERIFVSDGDLPEFTVSFGLAKVLEGNDSSRVFDRAMRALEAAQEAGPNSVFIHDGLNAVPAAGQARLALTV